MINIDENYVGRFMKHFVHCKPFKFHFLRIGSNNADCFATRPIRISNTGTQLWDIQPDSHVAVTAFLVPDGQLPTSLWLWPLSIMKVPKG